MRFVAPSVHATTVWETNHVAYDSWYNKLCLLMYMQKVTNTGAIEVAKGEKGLVVDKIGRLLLRYSKPWFETKSLGSSLTH